MARDRARALTIVPQRTGRFLVRQHVIAEDELEPVRNGDAIAFGTGITARNRAFGIVPRSPLVIDRNKLGLHDLPVRIEHGRHPVS